MPRRDSDPRLPRNAVITDTGVVLTSLPTAKRDAIVKPSNEVPKPIIGSLPHAPLSFAEVTKTLDTLFEWIPASSRYGTYFFMLPGPLHIEEDTRAQVFSSSSRYHL